MLTCAVCGYVIVTEKKRKKLSDGTMKEYRYCHCCGKNPNKKCPNRAIYVPEEELIKQIKAELSRYTIDEDFYRLATEALAEEDEIKVSQQNEKIAQINRQITITKNKLNSLRRTYIYEKVITDDAFFISEQDALNKEIARLEADRDSVMTLAEDWRNTAIDVFLFARYAKEDFDSDDWERKRTVIRQLGADLKLSGRTIHFTPVKYLVPIANSYSELTAKADSARTAPEQMKKGLKEDLISVWCARLDSN